MKRYEDKQPGQNAGKQATRKLLAKALRFLGALVLLAICWHLGLIKPPGTSTSLRENAPQTHQLRESESVAAPPLAAEVPESAEVANAKDVAAAKNKSSRGAVRITVSDHEASRPRERPQGQGKALDINVEASPREIAPPPSAKKVSAKQSPAYVDHATVEDSGTVYRLLPDDNEGTRHQKFLLRTASKRSVLIAHNIDLAPRISNLSVGDTVEFRGEFIDNERGGLVHWTHHDPSGRRKAGWLKHGGRIYQ